MDSLKQTFSFFDCEMKNWQIGTNCPSFIKAVCIELEDETPLTYVEDRLISKGYEKSNGRITFPGLCKLTGVCFDEDFLESVYNDVLNGDSLQQAMEGLAYVAQKLLEAEYEQEMSEDTMLCSWGDNEYTEDGKAI